MYTKQGMIRFKALPYYLNICSFEIVKAEIHMNYGLV